MTDRNPPRYDPPPSNGEDHPREPVPQSTMQLLAMQDALRTIDQNGDRRLSAYELSDSDAFAAVIAILASQRIEDIRQKAARTIDDGSEGSINRMEARTAIVDDEVIFGRDDLVAALTVTYPELNEQEIQQELDRMFRSIADIKLSDICPESICAPQLNNGKVIVYGDEGQSL